MTGLGWTTALDAEYRARGIGDRLVPGDRAAVIVVDLITGFTDPTCPPGSDLDGVVDHTAALLQWARANGVAIFFTSIAFDADDLDSLVWLRKMPALRVLLAASPWTEVDPRLFRGPDEPVVAKKAASAFFGTELADELRAAAVNTVLICGATTSGCVRATAIDACALNFSTFVVADCVGDRAEGPHDANLFDIDAKYADVINLDRVSSLLSAPAGSR